MVVLNEQFSIPSKKNFEQDDKLLFEQRKRPVVKQEPASVKRRIKAQTKFQEAIKELKSEG